LVHVVRYASDTNQQLDVFKNALSGDTSTNQQAANHAAGLQINDHINPGAILTSTTFDMEVVEKSSGTEKNVNFFTIKDCRITRRGSSLNKRNVLVDQYSFVGRLAEDGDAVEGTPDVAPSPGEAGESTGSEATGAGGGGGGGE
jgi:hypothetical protein